MPLIGHFSSRSKHLRLGWSGASCRDADFPEFTTPGMEDGVYLAQMLVGMLLPPAFVPDSTAQDIKHLSLELGLVAG